jgi:response regulator RpfG family c-di-GMP phosphodiesterase
MRLVALAQDVVIFHRLQGVEAAVAVAQQRKGKAHDPRFVEHFCRKASQLLAGLDDDPSWDSVLACEPGNRERLTEANLDEACRALADFTDLKSPFIAGHSAGVGYLAAEAGRHYGLPKADITALQRAGWLQDIGRVGVSSGIWSKKGPLSSREWEQVRLHTNYTERI